MKIIHSMLECNLRGDKNELPFFWCQKYLLLSPHLQYSSIESHCYFMLHNYKYHNFPLFYSGSTVSAQPCSIGGVFNVTEISMKGISPHCPRVLQLMVLALSSRDGSMLPGANTDDNICQVPIFIYLPK